MAEGPMAPRLETVAWRIGGRVQGVGFRWFTRNAAVGLGVDGWVRNLADGTVEAWVRGAKDDLRLLEQQLRKGPPGAEVTEFDAQPLDPSTAIRQGFEIRY